jgi:UDP-N-acetylglucosamine--N-acetylmuramyl-(pentapeptide) pyrophosphoryl-undecaprenol N-acetylglucosamine transferase
MATIYTKGDVAVSRAGATTLAELAVVGMPALLIPYPHAADDHQRENGNWYVAGGGALMFAQDQAGAARIGAEITDLAQQPGAQAGPWPKQWPRVVRPSRHPAGGCMS